MAIFNSYVSLPPAVSFGPLEMPQDAEETNQFDGTVSMTAPSTLTVSGHLDPTECWKMVGVLRA